MENEERIYGGKRKVTNNFHLLPEWTRCKVDRDDVLGIVGILGTVLNLLVVLLVYVYTHI